jgi:hypothetical protein
MMRGDILMVALMCAAVLLAIGLQSPPTSVCVTPTVVPSTWFGACHR